MGSAGSMSVSSSPVKPLGPRTLSRSNSSPNVKVKSFLDSPSRLFHSIQSTVDVRELLSSHSSHHYLQHLLERQFTNTMNTYRDLPQSMSHFSRFLEDKWLIAGDSLPISLLTVATDEDSEKEEEIPVTVRDFYMQIMYNFLFQRDFQLKSTSSDGAKTDISTLSTQQSSCDPSPESAFETNFLGYQIDLSEDAHKKASLLAQMKNRRVMVQRARSHAHLKEKQELLGHAGIGLEGDQQELTEADFIWSHSLLSFEMCRDFLLIFLFAVTQEVNKEGCYHLSFPSLPPLIGTSNQATNSNSSPQHHSNSGDGEVIYFNSNSKEERNAEQNSPNSQKTISLLERQSSDRNNHQRYQALTALYDQTYSRLSKRPADFLEYSVSGGWSKAECFFRHLEQLPVALSIGAVEEEGEFCPLVYVNAAFEQLTQYSKSEALGKSCSFLQCEKTEKAQTMKIKKALEKSRAVKVGVTNSKKDGSMFLNLLALLPIHDRHGRYRYVLGKHEDVGSTTVTMRSVQHSEDVLYWVALVLRNI